MKNTQKAILGIVIIILCIIGISLLNFANDKEVRLVNIDKPVLESDTSEWSKYQSKTGDFEIKYPADWTLLDSEEFAVNGGDPHNEHVQVNNILTQLNIKSMGLVGNSEWVKSRFSNELGSEELKSVSIEGGESLYYFNKSGIESSPSAYLVSDNHIYFLSLVSSVEDEQKEALFMKILSTFKFVSMK